MGTQSHLNFLPERQTDFIFTDARGGVRLGRLPWSLLGLYAILIVYGARHRAAQPQPFRPPAGHGLTINLFLYVFINMAMVMGLIPVVGVPLPLISYGGTAMMTVLIGFGLVMGVYVHRDVRIGRLRRRGLSRNCASPALTRPSNWPIDKAGSLCYIAAPPGAAGA